MNNPTITAAKVAGIVEMATLLPGDEEAVFADSFFHFFEKNLPEM
ncbi:MAG: hypothetical protein ACI9ZF_002656 [Bradyrhizobium sp.]